MGGSKNSFQKRGEWCIIQNVKLVLKLTIFTGFLLIAVFGFAAMGDGVGHCIASAMQGAVCPTGDLVGFASFHLGFFKNFSSASFETFLALAVLALAVLVLLLIRTGALPLFKEAVAEGSGGGGGGNGSPAERVREWLSLLENSPSLAFTR